MENDYRDEKQRSLKLSVLVAYALATNLANKT
jgi:hypothetical protein